MSFADPTWLLALALVPVALVAYLYTQRRARRYAIRFPALETLKLAAEGTRASWARHIPIVLALAAIAALALALGRPRTTYKVAVEQASIMLVLDHSGSMAATDVQPTRLGAAEAAADNFVAKLPVGIKIGAIGFSTTPDLVQGPVASHNAATELINSQQAGGSTATGNALALALELLHASDPKHPPSAIILLSDGSANAGQSPVAVADEAAKDRIPIDTVALGTPDGSIQISPLYPPQPVPPDPQLMQAIARASGGRSFDAQSADELSSIYNHLGDQLGSITRRREVTADFAIAALVLLLGAVALGVRVSGRLP
ncbi:MAG TPA: VWA domain-containing protein [Solirubrobacteraceae bacterium]|jgi:Ca-activated chloride channel family protein|nr:VWA domain-containing protein [Solirubrobacteraceae bacterium]